MDRRAPATPSHRDLVFCHQCEREWYRDEHGLICPQCQSDFVEVIEASNDPRDTHGIPEDHGIIPDPDEDDIDQFQWQSHEADQVPHERFRARYERTRSNPETGAQPQAGGWMGLLGNAFRIASDLVQPAAHPEGQRAEGGAQSPRANNFSHQSTSADGGTTFTRHVNGNGYSFTMTTTRSGVSPMGRDAHNPQPFQRQPQQIDDVIQQMLGNIGALHAHGMHSPQSEMPGMRGGAFMLNPEMRGSDSPFPHLFQLLGLPMMAMNGDAVYSQEGLDRIISQLMEQHQTGNAPGPATESAIQSLPQRPITEKDLGESGTAECSICMESVALGDKVTVLPCDHWFHYDCIKAWLSEHDTCPHCRQGITPRDNAGSSAARSPTQAPLNDTQSPEHNRTSIPGAYPFPAPQQARRRSSRNAGMFNQMRDVFGGGSGSSGSRPQ